MPIDIRRYPHFGGRTRPDTCAGCERIVPCYVTDDPDDRGLSLCPTCIQQTVEGVWRDRPSGPKGVVPGASAPPSTWAYSDEDCPARGPALSHTQDGPPVCVHCGTRLLHRKRPS